jgi:hypothetical protein
LHDGIEQHAMVTVRTTPFFTEYSISMLDEDLAAQLPNNKILSTSKDHFVFLDAAKENAPRLMENILQGIAHHLQTLQA